MSRDNSLLLVFSVVSAGPRAPWVASLAVGAVACGFAALGDISLVAAVTDFAVYAIFIVVNVALVALRYRMPDTPRSFATPLSVGRLPLLPLLGAAAAAIMALQLEAVAWAVGMATIALGLAVWVSLRRWPSGNT
jgi:basic amino acid/polyamine antiporter, APA family